MLLGTAQRNARRMAQTLSYHLRATLILGLPLIGAHVAQISIGVVDTIMLGWYSVEALAAVGLGSTYFFTLFIHTIKQSS